MNSARGSITLGDLVGKLDMLEVACKRYDRHGRLRLGRLIEEHGANKGLTRLVGSSRRRLPEGPVNGDARPLRDTLPAAPGASQSIMSQPKASRRAA
jgi:hypothetical protein